MRAATTAAIGTMTRLLLTFALFTVFAASARAQISFTSAIDMALRHSPRVLIAQADVDRARAALKESHDVYIPSVIAGSGLGYSYGFPVGQPSVYNFNAQSLVFNLSQHDYIRSARLALEAANYALMDARAATAEETAIAYIALDHDNGLALALGDQATCSKRLIVIAQDRLDAGQDTGIEVLNARLIEANIRLAVLRNEDSTEFDRSHLSHLTGMPEDSLGTVPASIPPTRAWLKPVLLPAPLNSPGVLAAYDRAESRAQQARGDARYERRPQISFGAQYNRFATFNNYSDYYLHFQHNNAAAGIQISLPLFDLAHRDRARQSAAEAVRALHEADQQRDQFLEGRQRLGHGIAQLALRAEIAELDQQLAQQQLDAMLIQLRAGNGNLLGHQANPKDEQTARIAAKDRAITLLNTTFDLQSNEISLLRQTGQLEPWLKSLTAAP